MARKEELLEIRKGKTGTGILIDTDGYISINEGINKTIKESYDGSEEWNCPNPFIIEAVMQRADTENANGRIYPMEILKKQCEKYMKAVKERNAMGECDHPDSSSISLKNISHIVTDIWFEKNVVFAKMELNITEGFRKMGICSSAGDIIANLLLNGIKIGVSTRGVGTIERKYGKLVVGDDYELLALDIVANPSTPNAWIGNKEEIHSYALSLESKNQSEKNSIQEKINKVKKILSE